jgi:hypothetical protein
MSLSSVVRSVLPMLPIGDNPTFLSIFQSICSIWSHSLTDLSIDLFGKSDGTVNDQIEALLSLRVIERLTFSISPCPKDDDLMKLSVHPNLPLTLKDVSWKWNTTKGRQRTDVHNSVRQSFAARGIMCHDIECESWQVSLL